MSSSVKLLARSRFLHPDVCLEGGTYLTQGSARRETRHHQFTDTMALAHHSTSLHIVHGAGGLCSSDDNINRKSREQSTTSYRVIATGSNWGVILQRSGPNDSLLNHLEERSCLCKESSDVGYHFVIAGPHTPRTSVDIWSVMIGCY